MDKAEDPKKTRQSSRKRPAKEESGNCSKKKVTNPNPEMSFENQVDEDFLRVDVLTINGN